MSARTPQTSERVSGHTLRYEGAPIEKGGAWTTGGSGRAGCSCGAKSPVLDSGGKRKRWHREHKAEVLAAQGDRP